MTILIRPSTESDAPTLADINIKAFANQGFIANAFPNIPYSVVHPLKRARYLQKMAHPQTQVISAVDTETGEVVGCARWVFPSERPGEGVIELMSDAADKEKGAGTTTELQIPPGTNREIYEGFFEILKESGKKHVRDDDIVLEFIATHPTHQGRGIGKALLSWGREQADRLGKRIYLEATDEGYPVYVKSGWRALERVEIEYERWGGEGVQVLTLMVKDPEEMTINIHPLTKPDIPQAVECIQTVFADDPFFLYIFDPDTYNIARNAASLRAHFLHGLSIKAPIYVAKETISMTKSNKSFDSSESQSEDEDTRIVGICWWHPPTPAPSTNSMKCYAQDILLSLRQLLYNIQYLGRGGLRLHRYKQWKTLQAQTHRRIWTDPRGYYFCNVIAVRKEVRGKGVGRMLVEAVTRRADEEGMSCYLESSRGAPNLGIYERLGFRERCTIDCFDEEGEQGGKARGEGVTLYCMIRAPATRKNNNQEQER
ncbi:acyl-CoA N-acyltransferase [Aspergillus undulatus]|uniref:acyl-CoA N-acyltransferase n=1 Tax=Aspergillus undulatus TaxID=1810928 RepID=UPI003CCD8F80